jgi:protein-tyrosine phosphatase
VTAPRPIDVRGTRLDLPGTSNLRDLGGYPTADGKFVGRGRLLRSEALTHAGVSEMHAVWQESHASHYQALALRTVIDLRSENETQKVPSAWEAATGAQVVPLPIAEGVEGTDTDVMGKVLSGALSRFDVEDLADLYTATLDRRAETFAAAIRVLADADRLPALVHCSAGKDRTGLFIALVLEVLGVERSLIVEDYALTGVLRPNRVEAYAALLREAGVEPDAVRVLFETPAAAMELALRHLDYEYGGAAAYLVDRGGLAPADLDALRVALTEDTAPA